MTKEQLKSNEYFIGMLYEDFSKMNVFQDGVKSKLILQNEANELEIIFPKDYVHKIPLIPGYIYVVKGDFLQRNLVLTVKEIILPTPLQD